MSRFHSVDRQTGYLLPPSVDEWLPEGHLARFIVEVVDGLDLGALEKAYAGRGSAAYHPSVLLALLVYGYANGVFSSRKIERATYDSVAFRFIAADSPPDHDTLATFRRRFHDELSDLFVQVLEMAQEMKLLSYSSWARSVWTAPRSRPMPHATAPCRGGTLSHWKSSSRPKSMRCWRRPSKPTNPPCRTAWSCRRKSPIVRPDSR